MTVPARDENARTVIFTPRIHELLDRFRGQTLFRLEPDTVGIAGAALMDSVLRSRPAGAEERPTFKPVLGRPITRPESATLMRALGADVRTALDQPLGTPDLTGTWPRTPHKYLRELVFGPERPALRALADRRLELTPKFTWAAVVAAAALRPGPRHRTALSTLATTVQKADTYAERRFALYLYRRMTAPICFTVAALVTNALWLAAPLDDDTPTEHILHETLRLLPPSWNILRRHSPEFPPLSPHLRPDDDLLLLPLLSHRDPAHWTNPDTYRPARWRHLDPDDHPGYLPFGHAGERCWGRHLVLPLATRLLHLARRDRLTIDPRQTRARVHLHGLLEVSDVHVIRQP
ncbi:cytochrome P450 [Amycolatopsis sulphurea]|uniref:Cytochrome P450 n=1 Tax=Amycolatopsis sulphurea TaxID=76022 RepID=A0A2A9G1Z8_9PSEU|nr:cytochrome P450 [Amycolatopsis sulphurea]PFG57438.1 cytochrome P450 [Amycolatopsis sulphurea]